MSLTDEEIRIILSIISPRAASPDAEKYGDWSIALNKKLLAALYPLNNA